MAALIPPERLRANLTKVFARMAEAAAKAGRRQADTKLIAVTKYVGVEEIFELEKLRVCDFGESRIQDSEKKIAAVGTGNIFVVNFHLIGHLQTNKADKAAKLFDWIHAVDSLRVAQALEKERRKLGLVPEDNYVPMRCLIEVNVAGEANKFGLRPDVGEIAELLKQCAELKALWITGLMTMAPYSEQPEKTSRPVFRKLRELLEEVNARGCYPKPLRELSMGMSQDYAIAIEEGATMVRVGSALFE